MFWSFLSITFSQWQFLEIFWLILIFFIWSHWRTPPPAVSNDDTLHYKNARAQEMQKLKVQTKVWRDAVAMAALARARYAKIHMVLAY